MDFIMMLTRSDRTVEDAEELAEAIIALGVRHIGFKDVGVPFETMQRVVARIRAANAVSYLEVVSTSPQTVLGSLTAGKKLGVDRILGGTDLVAAKSVLHDLSNYYPFPGRPVGHPTKLGGSPELVADHCREARRHGCGGVDLLAYRATEADPIALVRAARAALAGGKLIVAGSVNTAAQIRDLAKAGADAFTVGSAVLDGSFAPTKGTLAGQIRDILAATNGS